MFIAKNNDLIILANDSRVELEQQLQFMVYTSVEETEDTYILVNGKYEKEDTALTIKKEAKYKENDEKAEVAREGQEFTITLENEEGEEVELCFDTKRGTQGDLLTAANFIQAGVIPYNWIDNRGTTFPFTTVAQISQVSAKFMEKANVYDHWAYFKNLIDEATTIAEVDAIVIDYGINVVEETAEEE